MLTPHRHFRCEDEIWKPAQKKAKKEKTTLTKIIKNALIKFIQK
jgi:hypothetical protein